MKMKQIGLAVLAAVAGGSGVSPLVAGEVSSGGTPLPPVAAQAVWTEGREDEQNKAYRFETAFEWNGEGSAPVLRLAAAYGCRIKLNGEFAGYGPARAAKGFFRIDEWPLAAARKGENTVTVETIAHNVESYYWMKQRPFLQAEVVQGGRVLASEWTCREMAEYAPTGKRYSYQRPWQEGYRVGDCLTQRRRDAEKRNSDSSDAGANAPDIEESRALASESEKSEFEPLCVSAALREIKYLPRRVPYPKFEVRELKDCGGGMFDAGLDETGFLIVRVKAEKAGNVVLKWDEIISKGGVNPRRLGCDNTLKVEIAAAGEYEVETLEPYTGRWFVVEPTEGVSASVAIRTYKFPLEIGAGDDVVLRAAKETFAQNAVDVCTDCPSRERAGWLCDSWFIGCAEQFLTGRNDVERSFLENYALAESFEGLPEGMVPMCYPADHTRDAAKGRNFIPNWAMWLVLHVEDYVRRTGDRDMAAAFETRFDALLGYFAPFENADGLLENLKGWVFVEWSDANKFTDGVNYPSNMMYAEMLDALDRLYARPALAAKAAAIRAKIREQSFDGEFFRDHAVGGEVRPETSEVCQYYAFFTHTADATRDADLWRRLVAKDGFERLRPANAFIGNFLRFELLHRAGLKEQLRAEALPYFTAMADRTGTLWEHSNTRASCCHGFAAYIAVLLGTD